MALERAELRAPLGLQLIEERLDGYQRLRLQLEHADARILGHALVFHDPGREEDLQVPAHRRLRHSGRVRELTGAVRPPAEQLHHSTSRRVGERFEHIH